jgi:hypothetical protein
MSSATERDRKATQNLVQNFENQTEPESAMKNEIHHGARDLHTVPSQKMQADMQLLEMFASLSKESSPDPFHWHTRPYYKPHRVRPCRWQCDRNSSASTCFAAAPTGPFHVQPSSNTKSAATCSPNRGSGKPTTAAAATPGCCVKTAST